MSTNYYLAMRVTTTSDWTSVYLKNQVRISAPKFDLVSGADAPELTYGSDPSKGLLTYIGKKQYDQTKVVLDVTFTLSGVQNSSILTFNTQKGSIGTTSVLLYNFNTVTKRLIASFENTKTGGQTNGSGFEVNSGDVMQGVLENTLPQQVSSVVLNFSLAPPATGYQCSLAIFPFIAASSIVSGSFVASTPIHFYLLNEEQFRHWASTPSTSYCGGPPQTYIVGIVEVKTFPFTWPNSASLKDTFLFLFLNFNQISAAVVFRVSGASLSSTPITSTSVSATSTQSPKSLVANASQTYPPTNVSTNILTNLLINRFTNPNLLFGWFIIVLSVYLVYWVVKRRKTRGKSKGSEGETVPY